MLGFDTGVGLAFWLSIASGVLCVVYGVIYWNVGSDEVPVAEDAAWEQAETAVNEEL